MEEDEDIYVAVVECIRLMALIRLLTVTGICQWRRFAEIQSFKQFIPYCFLARFIKLVKIRDATVYRTTIYRTKIHRTTNHRTTIYRTTVHRTDSLSNRQFIEPTVYRTTVYRTDSLSKRDKLTSKKYAKTVNLLW